MGPEMSLSEFLKAPLISAQACLFPWEWAQRPASPGTRKIRVFFFSAAVRRTDWAQSLKTQKRQSWRCSTTLFYANKKNVCQATSCPGLWVAV